MYLVRINEFDNLLLAASIERKKACMEILKGCCGMSYMVVRSLCIDPSTYELLLLIEAAVVALIVCIIFRKSYCRPFTNFL